MLPPPVMTTSPSFTSVTVTGVDLVVVVIVAVPFIPGCNSCTDFGWPSTVNLKESGTVSSLVPSGRRTTSVLPFTAITASSSVCVHIADDVCAQARLAPRHKNAAASEIRLATPRIVPPPVKAPPSNGKLMAQLVGEPAFAVPEARTIQHVL